MRPYSTRRSDTRWLRKILTSLRFTFKSPITMGSLKCCSYSSRSVRCSNTEGVWYVMMSRVQVSPVISLHLTTIDLW